MFSHKIKTIYQKVKEEFKDAAVNVTGALEKDIKKYAFLESIKKAITEDILSTVDLSKYSDMELDIAGKVTTVILAKAFHLARCTEQAAIVFIYLLQEGMGYKKLELVEVEGRSLKEGFQWMIKGETQSCKYEVHNLLMWGRKSELEAMDWEGMCDTWNNGELIEYNESRRPLSTDFTRGYFSLDKMTVQFQIDRNLTTSEWYNISCILFSVQKYLNRKQYDYFCQLYDNEPDDFEYQAIQTAFNNEIETCYLLSESLKESLSSESKTEMHDPQKNPLEHIQKDMMENTISVLSEEAFSLFYEVSDLIKKWETQIIRELYQCSDKIDLYMSYFNQYVSHLHLEPITIVNYFKNEIIRMYYLALALNHHEMLEKIQAGAKKIIDTQFQKINDVSQTVDFNLLAVRLNQIIYFSVQFDLLDSYKDKILENTERILEMIVKHEKINTSALKQIVFMLKQTGLLEDKILLNCTTIVKKLKHDKKQDYSITGRYDYNELCHIHRYLVDQSKEALFSDVVSDVKVKLNISKTNTPSPH